MGCRTFYFCSLGYLPLVLVGSCSGSNESLAVRCLTSVKDDFAATSLPCATIADLLDSVVVESDSSDLLYRWCTVWRKHRSQEIFRKDHSHIEQMLQ